MPLYTPATLLILSGSILLLLSTISNPIIKSIHFLSININTINTNTNTNLPTIDGQVRLGTFGYCFELGSQLACSKPKLGYNLQFDTLPIPSPSQLNLDSINSILKVLSYTLILHPIAAALALLSAIFGLVSHFREYSRSCYTSCLSSLASTVALLAFLFDIITFTVAKNKLNAISNPNFSLNAQLGNAIWITLAGWLALTLAGFLFCTGRCLFARRHRQQTQADQLRPQPDQEYTHQMRLDAHQAEKDREKNHSPIRNQSSLPAFTEYNNQHSNSENIPLNRFNPNDEEPYSDQSHHHQSQLSSIPSPDPYPSQPIYRRQPLAHHPSLSSQPSINYSNTGAAAAYHQPANSCIPPLPPIPPHLTRRPTNDEMYNNLPAHVSPASNTMNSPHRTPSSLTSRRLPQSLMPAGGMAYSTNTPPGSYSTATPPSSHPASNSYASPPPSSSSLSAKPSLAYPSYDRLAVNQRQAQQPVIDPFVQRYHPGYPVQHHPSLNSPGQQAPIHQASLDSTHRLLPQPNSHSYHDSSPFMPQGRDHYSTYTLSEEPSQLAHYPNMSQATNFNSPGHQIDNSSTVSSHTTTPMPFGPSVTHTLHEEQSQRSDSNPSYPSGRTAHFDSPADHPVDNRSTVYSQPTPVFPQEPHPFPQHMTSSAQQQPEQEHDMYGGTEATAAFNSESPKLDHPVIRHPLPHPPSLPPLSFSPPPAHPEYLPQDGLSPNHHDHHHHHQTPPSHT